MGQAFGSKEEAKLMRAIKQAVDLVAAGSTPDEALSKIARDEKMHPDTLPLLVSAYNVGQQTHHREKCASSGAGVSCLTQTFPIARLENVVSRVYPDAAQVKAAHAAELAELVDPVYLRPPEPLQAYAMEKKAELDSYRLPTRMPPPRHRREPVTAAVTHLKLAVDRHNSRVDVLLQQSRDELHRRLDAVRGYFKQAADRRLPLAEVENNSRAVLGGDVGPIFDFVAARVKEARAAGPVVTTRPVDLSQPPYSLVKAALDKAREHVDEQLYVQQLKTKLASEVASADPFVRDASPVLQSQEPLESWAAKRAGFFTNMASLAVGRATAPKPGPARSVNELVGDVTDQLQDPAHLAHLRSIQAQAMLTDLANNDEVLSGFEPEEIMEAYNELTQLSPNIATQPAVVRAMLRRRLSGGLLESHDAQQLTEINRMLGQQTASQIVPPQNSSATRSQP